MSRILVAEDDAGTRRLIATALEPLGMPVHFTSDGIHAMDALRCNGDFDLLVTDISMPLLDGRQLIDTIMRDPSLPRLPILIMSGVVGIKDISDLLDAGATQFIAKPINMKTFRQDVRECLEMAPLMRA